MNRELRQGTTRTMCSVFWLCFIGSHGAHASSIHGTVRYPNGKPASGFIVLIVPASNEPIRPVKTTVDSFGRYAASGFLIGDYAIYAYNETPEYPARTNMFLSKSPDHLNVDGVADAAADIILPQPAAIIHAIITSNGKTLDNAEVSLCHSDETWRSATIQTDNDGRFVYYVPSNEKLSITVLRPQSKPSTLVEVILEPGESRDLAIKVEEHVGTSPELACRPFR